MMHIEKFYDSDTATISYIVVDSNTKACAVIDPVLDYNLFTGEVTNTSAEKIIQYITNNKLDTQWLLETHIHADHITASDYLQQKIGGKKGIGIKVKDILRYWTELFETQHDTPLDGQQFDHFFDEGDTFYIGTLPVKVWCTPGHTPACICYLINDCIFVGDTLFSPQLGTARCDFPGGSAEKLYKSIKRIYNLADHTTIYFGHDYPPSNTPPTYSATVALAKKNNIMIQENTPADEYILKRTERDKTLSAPKLLLPAIQTNIRAGNFGKPSKNGKQFIKTPVYTNFK